jgi:hypothetical protein
MQIPFVEQNCVITHEGKSFESGGAVVTENYLVAYPDKNGVLKDWHGNQIGTYKTISSRIARFFGRMSWQGSKYYYMRGFVNGKAYALRGFGEGMVAKGKAIKG